MDKKIKKSIFARIKQWLLKVFGLSKKDEDSNTKPASNDAGQEDVDTPSTIAEKSAEEHTEPHSSNTEQTASNDDRQCDANNTNEEQFPIEEKIFKKVKLIEEYLALDKIASEAKTIDYSFVKDSIIRGKLISDHTSMWRCRLGTRTHNPEFNEFCLYVQMQVEALLLYYYNKMFNNNEHEIIQHLNNANPKAKYPYTKVQYSGMLYAFHNEHSIQKHKIKGKYHITTDILDTVRELRNSIVHSSKTIELSGKFVSQVLDSARSLDITLYDFIIPDVIIHTKAVFDFNTIIHGDPNKFSEYEGINISTFNNSIKLKILKELKPFDAIIIDLKKWITAIQNELANVK